MPPVIVNAVDRVKTTVKEFTLAQKTLVIIGVAVLLLGGAVLYSWLAQPNYKTLYPGLSDKDLAAVTQQLESSGIKYQVAAGGTVKVPEKDVYTARMALAENDLPSAPVTGYTVLDDLGVAASDFQQKMAEKRALEGELARAIQTMNSVEKAQVALALPKDTVFVDPKKKPETKASVTVTPRSGAELENREIQSIIKMVSSAIPNLSEKNVSVVDTAGRVLSDSINGGVAQATELEKRLEAKVLAVVERQVGQGNAQVAVTATLSDDTTDKTTRVFTDPEGGIKPLSSSSASEQYQGGSSAVVGVLGPDNIGNPYGANEQKPGQYQTGQEVVNNAVNSEITHTTRGPGAVESKHVSVVLNAATARRLDMNAMRDVVAAAVGINEAKGDTVIVTRMPIDTTAQKEAEAAAKAAAQKEQAEKTAAMIRQAIIAGLIILLLIIVAAITRRRAKKREREQLDLGELDQMPEPYTLTPPLDEPLAIAPPEEEISEEPVEEIEEPQIDPALLKIESKRQEIAELALDKPQLVAEQLRAWMGGR